jgi:hypothetical protein
MPNDGVACRTQVAKARLGLRRSGLDAVLNQTFLAPFDFRFAGLGGLWRVALKQRVVFWHKSERCLLILS